MRLKFFWLHAGENGTPITEPATDNTSTQDSLEPTWEGSAELYDPYAVGDAVKTEDEIQEEEVVEGDEDQNADDTGEDDEDEGIDPKALKAAEKKLKQKQAEELLNDPEALKAHLKKLEGAANNNADIYNDPEFEAELGQIKKSYEADKELGGDVTLSLLLGQKFMEENGIEERDATPLLMKVARVANAEALKNVREELAETKLAVKTLVNYIKSNQQQQQQQQTESKVVTFIKKELPDYDSNPKTQNALKASFRKLVEQNAKETAELVGGDWSHIAQEMIKNPVTYNNLLRNAILQVKPDSVKSVSRSGVQTGVASKPGVRRQPQSQQKIDTRKLEPDWNGFMF